MQYLRLLLQVNAFEISKYIYVSWNITISIFSVVMKWSRWYIIISLYDNHKVPGEHYNLPPFAIIMRLLSLSPSLEIRQVRLETRPNPTSPIVTAYLPQVAVYPTVHAHNLSRRNRRGDDGCSARPESWQFETGERERERKRLYCSHVPAVCISTAASVA